MSQTKDPAVQAEIARLREKYRDTLKAPQWLSETPKVAEPPGAPKLTVVDFTRGRREMVEGDL